MPGRNEEEAWRAFRDPVRRAIGAVSVGTRLVERAFPNGVRLLASPAAGIPFGPALRLSFSFQVEPFLDETLREWRVTTRRYDYTLTAPGDPRRLVFGWHWHPASRRSDVTYPHIHVPTAEAFSTRHIPTGRVALEDVIMFGFDDLGVTPTYDGARDAVAEVAERHKRYRTWS